MTKRRIPQLEGQSVRLFRESVKSEETWLQYERRFWHFLEWIKDNPDSFLAHSEKDRKWAEQKIIDYISMQKERVRKGEISNITVSNFKKPLKLFLEMNDVTLNWKKINKTLPSMRRYVLDRAPTVEEIRRLVRYPDRRVEVMVLFMCSSGIRVGAWDWLRVGNLHPVMKNGSLLACKVDVYEGGPDFPDFPRRFDSQLNAEQNLVAVPRYRHDLHQTSTTVRPTVQLHSAIRVEFAFAGSAYHESFERIASAEVACQKILKLLWRAKLSSCFVIIGRPHFGATVQ